MKTIITRQQISQAIKRSEEYDSKDCDGCFIHHLVLMFHLDMYRPCSYIKQLLNEQHHACFRDTDGCKSSWISPTIIRGRSIKI